MRTIDAGIESQQASLNRYPVTDLVIRDVMLRLDQDWETSAYNTDFPDADDGSDIPQHPYDEDDYDKYMTRAWCDASNVTIHHARDMSSSSNWQGSSYVLTRTTDGVHRVSCRELYTYYAYNGDILFTHASGNDYTFKSSAYTCNTDHVALACAKGGSSIIYMAKLHEEGTYKYVSLHRVEFGGDITDCPHTFPVDADYNISSLQWFDAERLNNEDIIILNERTYGQPVVVRYKQGMWSTPRHISRIDDLGSNSFMRIGSIANITDSNGDEVLWATGRISRPGSTGEHPQAFDFVTRTKDGVHWSFDRYCYLTSTNMCGKLLVYGDYVYYPRGATVMRGRRTWLMNSEQSALEIDASDDVFSWTYNQSGAGAAAKGSTRLAAGDGTYNRVTEDSDYLGRWTNADGELAVSPGMWLWRGAGYDDASAASMPSIPIAVEGIDQVPGSYELGNRVFSITSREIVMRLLYDWVSDQNWQIMSETKHYDDCDVLSHLYSISSGQIEVQSDDDEELTGGVDEDEITESDDTLIFDTPNKPGIHLCTKPPDTRNFHVRTRFSISDDYAGSTSVLSSGYVDSTFSEMTGTGGTYDENFAVDGMTTFGVAGEDFSDYYCDGEDYCRYIIVVTNTDGTITWAWIYRAYSGQDEKFQVTEVSEVASSSSSEWNGAGSTGKTASTWRIARADGWARLGTGIGCVGCVGGADSQYNLIAAIPDLIGGKFWLVIRRGDEDDSAWIPWAYEDINVTVTKGKKYEVELVRRGNLVEARMYQFSASGSSRSAATDKISETWPFDDPMVYLDSEAWNATDKGKVGVICTISVPESQLGSCRSDRDWLIRNPDLFTVEVASGTQTLLKDPFSDWQDFTNGYTWNGSAWAQKANSEIPPFHFGGETFNPSTTDDYANTEYFGDQWEYDDLDDYTPSHSRWRRPKVSPTNYAASYNTGQGNWGPDEATRQMPWGYENAGSNIWDGTYGSNMLPMFIRGDNQDLQDDTIKWHYGFARWTEMVCAKGESGIDALYLWDVDSDDWSKMGSWHYASGDSYDDKMPDGKIYPGFYLPGRASPHETETAHGKGTIIRQHWNPVIMVEGVWAYDDETDKTLEWAIEEIAAKAGVLDFDTEYSINEASVSTQASIPYWLTDVFSDDVYQKDFDITVTLPTVPESQGDFLTLLCRANTKFGSATTGDVSSLSALAVNLGLRAGITSPVLELQQTSTNTSGWIMVDRIEIPGDNIGNTVRFVGREKFITVYSNGCKLGTLHTEEIFGVDADGYAETFTQPGYIAVQSYGSYTPVVDVTQPELWEWTDAITLDSRQNAINGLDSAIRDRRVRFVGTLDTDTGQPMLRFSNMALRYTTATLSNFSQWLGTITDHQSGDANYPAGGAHVSIYRDQTAETDRIPTHIRVEGYETGDYIDDNSARRYGLMFQSHHVPSLDEEAAYTEASYIVKDAIAHSGSRKPTAAAQLDWEPEDALLLDYTTYDDGEEVSDYYIVDSVSFSFDRSPNLQIMGLLRRFT